MDISNTECIAVWSDIYDENEKRNTYNGDFGSGTSTLGRKISEEL